MLTLDIFMNGARLISSIKDGKQILAQAMIATPSEPTAMLQVLLRKTLVLANCSLEDIGFITAKASDYSIDAFCQGMTIGLGIAWHFMAEKKPTAAGFQLYKQIPEEIIPCNGTEQVIRKMREQDLDEIMAIEQATFSDAWSRLAFQNEIKHELGQNMVYVENKKILGYMIMWIIADRAEITKVAVKESVRNLGIATVMLHHCLRYAQQQGVLQMVLRVRRSNQAAHALYKKNRFTETGTEKEYYADNDEDAIVMTCYLRAFNKTQILHFTMDGDRCRMDIAENGQSVKDVTCSDPAKLLDELNRLFESQPRGISAVAFGGSGTKEHFGKYYGAFAEGLAYSLNVPFIDGSNSNYQANLSNAYLRYLYAEET